MRPCLIAKSSAPRMEMVGWSFHLVVVHVEGRKVDCCTGGRRTDVRGLCEHKEDVFVFNGDK